MIFETAAAISGVTPADTAANSASPVCSDNSQSRNSPTVKCAIGANACGVVRIANQARDFVVFIGNQRLSPETACSGNIGQLHLRPHALFGRWRRDSGQFIARPRRACVRQQRFQIGHFLRCRIANSSSGDRISRRLAYNAKYASPARNHRAAPDTLRL